jgi:hypothetical protein
MRSFPVTINCQLSEHGTKLPVLTGATNPVLAGLVVRSVNDKLLSAFVIHCLGSSKDERGKTGKQSVVGCASRAGNIMNSPLELSGHMTIGSCASGWEM